MVSGGEGRKGQGRVGRGQGLDKGGGEEWNVVEGVGRRTSVSRAGVVGKGEEGEKEGRRG